MNLQSDLRKSYLAVLNSADANNVVHGWAQMMPRMYIPSTKAMRDYVLAFTSKATAWLPQVAGLFLLHRIPDIHRSMLPVNW